MRALFAMLLWLVLADTVPAADSRPTNAVLIIADHMGFRDIEPYGAQDVRTPALSQLANQGVTMTNFYAAAPVCGPSRAALYTGLYPVRLGFERNIDPKRAGLSASTPSLPRWLSEAGYRTALFGKWHLGSGRDSSPMAHGFDEFFGHHAWTIGYHDHLTSDGRPGLYLGDETVNRSGYLPDLITDAAIEFIQRQHDQPFFVTLAYNTGLPPYQPPGLPASEWNKGWDAHLATRSDYVKMVERMDQGIGRVLDTLDSMDLDDHTLVIFMYDHGGRHVVDSGPLFHGFGTLWEGGIRIPAILRLPTVIPANQRVAMPGIAMDLTATIVEVAGLKAREMSLDGISLIPFLDGTRAPPSRPFYWRVNSVSFGQQRAIREGQWKYLEHGHTQFLFDLSSDVSERNNVYYQKPDVAKRLREKLTVWLQTF